ncbi:hypothetical protein ScPMuIL_017581 [Solemya velum]
MPKKFKGENSKAVEARARTNAKKQEEKEEKERKLLDEFWKDDDKHVAKKQQRKDEKERKRIESLEKKKELQKLHDEEMDQLKTPHQPSLAKLTRAEIEAHVQREATTSKRKEEEVPIPENFNRLNPEGEEARSVEEAISVLSLKPAEVEKHPEKRMKAAFQKYEEDNLPKLKQQYSNLRLSQIKQILKKEWNKSPENPMNQRLALYNMKT